MSKKAVVMFPIPSFRQVHFRKGVGQNALELANSGFEVTFITFENEVTDSIQVPHENITFETVKPTEIQIVIGTLREFLRFDPDLFVIQDDGFRNLTLILLARILQIETIIRPDYVVGNYESESFFGRIGYRLILSFISMTAGLVVTQTKASADELSSIAPELEPLLYWSPLGISPKMEQEIRKSTDTDMSGCQSILYVGSLEEVKNVSTLIESFNSIKEEYPNWTLHIVGDGSLSYEEYDLERIRFHGFLDEKRLARQYVRAEIFCFPSRNESFGKVLTEAAMAQTAIITTQVGIAGYLLRNAGKIVPKDDVAAMSEEISDYIESEKMRKEDARKLQENAEEFSSSSTTDIFIEGVRRLMHE